jgi:hypothetical protein
MPGCGQGAAGKNVLAGDRRVCPGRRIHPERSGLLPKSRAIAEAAGPPAFVAARMLCPRWRGPAAGLNSRAFVS